jgi:hypothetical protein
MCQEDTSKMHPRFSLNMLDTDYLFVARTPKIAHAASNGAAKTVRSVHFLGSRTQGMGFLPPKQQSTKERAF